jgi:hypothetical protein
MSALILSFLVPFCAYAAELPPGFDLARYQKLVAVAGEKGEPLQAPDFEYRVLTHLDPADPAQPHKADYFSAVGGKDSNGHFGAIQVSMESEDWRKRESGDWEIEEWNWTAWTDGTLVSVYHTLVVETPEGSVLDIQGLPVGEPTDKAELARWGSKVEEWYGYAP